MRKTRQPHSILVALFCLLAILLPTASPAQTDSLDLSIEQLFERGMKHSLPIEADRLQESMAREAAQTARRDLLPDIEVGLRGAFVGQPVVWQHGLSDATRPETPHWSQNYAVDFTQPLYEGGRLKYAVRRADLQRRIAALQTATDQADLKLNLLDHYLELFSLYKQHLVLRRNIDESERRLVDIRRMKREGLITNNDVLRSEMQLTDNRLALQQTENDISLVSRQLDILLGLDENLLLRPDTTLLYKTYSLDTADGYIAQAYAADPAMLLLKQQTRLAQNDVRLTRAERLPRLSLYASNTLARPLSRTMDDLYNNTWNIGLSLSYPLSALYRTKNRLNAARLAVELRRNAEAQKEQEIRLTVHSAYLHHREAVERVEALKLSVRQAEENYRIMRNRYLNQLAILTDLLDADNLRLNAELQLTTARTQVIRTYYELQRAAGKL